ncbi:hypothetical protein ACW9ID_21445 [Pseudomonas gingeri]
MTRPPTVKRQPLKVLHVVYFQHNDTISSGIGDSTRFALSCFCLHFLYFYPYTYCLFSVECIGKFHRIELGFQARMMAFGGTGDMIKNFNLEMFSSILNLSPDSDPYEEAEKLLVFVKANEKAETSLPIIKWDNSLLVKDDSFFSERGTRHYRWRHPGVKWVSKGLKGDCELIARDFKEAATKLFGETGVNAFSSIEPNKDNELAYEKTYRHER